jgi:aryl-alcohol dehydrogenase-like predicted oxidoreductase
MKRVVLPGTDLAVSRLSFGTGSLHHLPVRGRRLDLLAAALDHGFTHFDTAPYYGLGLAESELGRAFGKRRGEVTIATKFGLYPHGRAVSSTPALWLRKGLGKLATRYSVPIVDWSAARAAKSLRDSLERLRTDYVDILFLHEPSGEAVRSDELWRWLEGEKQKGTIRAWGMSGEPSELRTSISHPLAMVLQARDSTLRSEADAILQAGRPLQLTFGYLSASAGQVGPMSAAVVLEAAFLRNRTGSILISTRRPEHLAALTAVADGGAA